MFWKKKKNDKNNQSLQQDEDYQTIRRKIVGVVADIDVINNRLSILSESVKSNRANIGVLKRREHEEAETEDTKKDTPRYL